MPSLLERITRRFRSYLATQGIPEEEARTITLPSEPHELGYFIASALQTNIRNRQLILEESSAGSRLRRELAVLETLLGGPSAAEKGSFSLN